MDSKTQESYKNRKNWECMSTLCTPSSNAPINAISNHSCPKIVAAATISKRSPPSTIRKMASDVSEYHLTVNISHLETELGMSVYTTFNSWTNCAKLKLMMLKSSVLSTAAPFLSEKSDHPLDKEGMKLVFE